MVYVWGNEFFLNDRGYVIKTISLLGSIILNIILVITLFFKSALNDILKDWWNRKEKEKSKRIEALGKSYELVYSPLRALLLEGHVTTCQSVLYPKLSHRLKNAWHEFKKFKRLRTGIDAIFDYGKERSAEIEFGSFSINDIKKIVMEQIKWADSDLLSHIQWAERSRYETHQSYEFSLTEEELELIDYIYDTYHKLNRKVFPK